MGNISNDSMRVWHRKLSISCCFSRGKVERVSATRWTLWHWLGPGISDAEATAFPIRMN
jgi:hypothetical protein